MPRPVCHIQLTRLWYFDSPWPTPPVRYERVCLRKAVDRPERQGKDRGFSLTPWVRINRCATDVTAVDLCILSCGGLTFEQAPRCHWRSTYVRTYLCSFGSSPQTTTAVQRT